MKVQACDGHIKTPYGHGSPLPLWYASCPILRNRWRGRSVFPLLSRRIIIVALTYVRASHWVSYCQVLSILPGVVELSLVSTVSCCPTSLRAPLWCGMRRCRGRLLVIWGRGFRDAIPIAIQSALYVADQVIPSPELR